MKATKSNSKMMMIRITADLMMLFMALLMFVNFILPSMLSVLNSQEKMQSRNLMCIQILSDLPPRLRFETDILLAIEANDWVAPDLEDNPCKQLAKWNGTPTVRTVAIDAKKVSGGEVKLLAALTSLESFARPQDLRPIKLIVYRDADMRAVAEEIREGRIDSSRSVIELKAENGFRASIPIPPTFLEQTK